MIVVRRSVLFTVIGVVLAILVVGGAIVAFTGILPGVCMKSAPEGSELPLTYRPVPVACPPGGYAFESASIATTEELGESAPIYLPAGGEMAVYDYFNADQYFLSVQESPSPYPTLDAWLEAINYDPEGDKTKVSGVEVLLEDLSDDAGPWFSATFIDSGMFVVVDGDEGRDAVLNMTARAIAAIRAAK
jgi:hypothetical protein